MVQANGCIQGCRQGCSTLMIGFACILAGIGIPLVAARLTTLECERLQPLTDQGTCELTSAGLLGSNTQEIPLQTIERAEVAQSEDDEGNVTYRVELVLADKSVPFVQVWSSGHSGKQEKVARINAFVQNSNQTALAIEQDDRLLFVGIGGLFVFIGLLIWFSPVLNILGLIQ